MRNLEKIEVELKDNFVTVWLNQPLRRNALNPDVIEELIKTFRWIGKQNELMVIIIRGRGKSFCSGADINWMIDSGLQKYPDCYRDSKILAACFKIIYESDKVVINMVHGNVFGGALGFLGAADFTFAVKNTKFCLPELRLGLIPSVIMPYLLSKAKPADIKYHMFSGGVFTSEVAKKIELIDDVYDSVPEMEFKVNELIQKICSTSPSVLSEAKHLFRILNKSFINSGNIKKTVKIITRLKMTDDARERMGKFKSLK